MLFRWIWKLYIKKDYTGLWANMDSDFRDYLEKLIQYGEKADTIFLNVISLEYITWFLSYPKMLTRTILLSACNALKKSCFS